MLSAEASVSLTYICLSSLTYICLSLVFHSFEVCCAVAKVLTAILSVVDSDIKYYFLAAIVPLSGIICKGFFMQK